MSINLFTQFKFFGFNYHVMVAKEYGSAGGELKLNGSTKFGLFYK